MLMCCDFFERRTRWCVIYMFDPNRETEAQVGAFRVEKRSATGRVGNTSITCDVMTFKRLQVER